MLQVSANIQNDKDENLANVRALHSKNNKVQLSLLETTVKVKINL